MKRGELYVYLGTLCSFEGKIRTDEGKDSYLLEDLRGKQRISMRKVRKATEKDVVEALDNALFDHLWLKPSLKKLDALIVELGLYEKS